MGAWSLFLLLRLLLLVWTTEASAPRVDTTSGTLLGLREESLTGTVSKFLGVRYALAPTGDRRFLPPQSVLGGDPNSEDTIVRAEHYGAACMQPKHMAELMYPQLRGTAGDESSSDTSEDCLFLNVFVAESETKRKAVMVWLPGEGFNYAKSEQFDGSELALRGDVVVVTVSYRVSVFGFLSTGTRGDGNMGLLDQLAALRWVRKNIAAFGGDPGRVTLFGRFSGAMSVSALLVSPLATVDGRPLFNRAILQSGIAGESWTVDKTPLDGVRNLSRQVDCLVNDAETTPQVLVDCLRRVPAHRLLEKASMVHSWRLVIDNTTLPMEPLQAVTKGRFLHIPVILGTTADEGSLCLLGHYAMKTKYLPKILEDDLDEDDFKALATSFLREYLQPEWDDEERLVNEMVRRYRNDGLSPSWRDRYLKMCGDGYVRAKTILFAKQLAHHGSRTFLYEFTHRPSFSIHPAFVRAAHGDDIPFAFGLQHSSQHWTSEEVTLGRSMMAAWSNFAKYGDPNPMSGTTQEWPAFSSKKKMLWEFSTQPSLKKVKKLTNERVLGFWQKESERLAKRKKHQRHSNWSNNLIDA